MCLDIDDLHLHDRAALRAVRTLRRGQPLDASNFVAVPNRLARKHLPAISGANQHRRDCPDYESLEPLGALGCLGYIVQRVRLVYAFG
jgi:hypothetical protein